MYSYEERLKAVQLYIQYDKSYASVFRELGYPPSSHSIKLWYKEYEETGGLHKSYSSPIKYSDEQRKAAVQYYVEHGRSKSRTVKALGYPTRQQLTEWLKQDLPDEVHPCAKGQSLVHLSKEQKEQVAIELCTRDGSAQEIADKYNVSRYSVYNWAWDLFGKGNVSPMPRKKPDTTTVAQDTVDTLKQEIENLHNEAEDLKRTVYRLQLEKDVLEKAAEILKKDEGVSLEKLTNREKAVVIGALRSKYKLHELLEVFHMAKSSYCYQQSVLNAPDKYADLRVKIRAVFDESSSRYGYRRIHSSLKNDEFTVPEKVIRKLMQEEKLIVPNVKRKNYNSYRGEITPAVPNVIERNFHAEQPNIKWLTDITEFHIPAGKIYLSPIIDCFDGLPVSWTIGTSPDAELVNTIFADVKARPGFIWLRGRESQAPLNKVSLLARKLTGMHARAVTVLEYSPEIYQHDAVLMLYYDNMNNLYLRKYYSETLHLEALGIIQQENGHKTEYQSTRTAVEKGCPVWMRMMIDGRKTIL